MASPEKVGSARHEPPDYQANIQPRKGILRDQKSPRNSTISVESVVITGNTDGIDESDRQTAAQIIEDKSFVQPLPQTDPSPSKPSQVRCVIIRRALNGEFGLQLRKSIMYDRSSGERIPIFLAEPGTRTDLGLLPGDRLITVNDLDVRTSSREEIVELMRKASEDLKLTVQQVPELSELGRYKHQKVCCRCRKRQQRFKMTTSDIFDSPHSHKLQADCDNDNDSSTATATLNTSQSRSKVKRYWLVHKQGYTACTILEKVKDANDKETMLKIRLEHNGQALTVEEDDVEVANSLNLDRVENLTLLKYLNESCLLHVLRARYNSNLIHTYAGKDLIVINPMFPLTIYSEKIMGFFKGQKQDDLPPHVYSVAQSAYRNILAHQENQFIVLIGRSGAGKTSSLKHILHYYSQVTSSSRKEASQCELKLRAFHTLTEPFLCSRTISNSNASRCSQMIVCDFDHKGNFTGLSFHIFLLERTRLVRRPDAEPAFHAFYYLLAGLTDAETNKFNLQQAGPDPNLFMTPLHRPEDKQVAKEKWLKIKEAAIILGVSDKEWEVLTQLMVAIYHLGCAGAVRLPSGSYQFEKMSCAERAAPLLGTSVSDLRRHIFELSLQDSATPVTENEPLELLQGFVTGLYTDITTLIMFFVNRAFAGSSRTAHTISILDAAGFQHASACGRSVGGSFEDLWFNYVQERLHAVNYETFLSSDPQEEEEQSLKIEREVCEQSPSDLISLMDRQGVEGSQGLDEKGLLWLLDEESVGGNEKTFVDRVHKLYHLHRQEVLERNRRVLRRAKGGNFVLNHCCGSLPVLYNPLSWLRNCREYASAKQTVPVLQNSSNQELARLITEARAQSGGPKRGPLRPGTSSLYRQRSVSAQVKSQADYLVDLIRKCSLSGKSHFIYCCLPVANAGLCDMRSSAAMAPELSACLSVPLLRQQIRSFQILSLSRTHKYAFAEKLTYKDFNLKFQHLIKRRVNQSESLDAALDEKLMIHSVLQDMGLESNQYMIGNSKVFFRSGCISNLEDVRDQSVKDHLVLFQSQCRGFLTRKRTQEQRAKSRAIGIIQRNCEVYLELKNWSWFRLLSKVKPLIKVSGVEEGSSLLREKLSKADKERSDLKEKVNHLENEILNLTSELRQEKAETLRLTEELDTERHKRIKSDKLSSELRQRLESEKERFAQLESEVNLLHQRDMQASLEKKSAPGEADVSSSETEDEQVFKIRLERLNRDLATARSRLELQEAEFAESKRQLEVRCQDVLSERDVLVEELSVSKRRALKLQQEMSDLRSQHEEAATSLLELQRKQKRFDSELQRAGQSLRAEVESREKLQREKDTLLGEKWRLEKEVQDSRVELSGLQDRCSRQQEQLQEINNLGASTAGSASESEVEFGRLKRARSEYELKIRNLEDEVEELAAQTESLEQDKNRLEMELERVKQTVVKDAEDREEELDKMRYAQSKRLRQLEDAIEEEQVEKQRLAREKREVERELSELISRDKVGEEGRDLERKAKREVKRLRAVLKDTQAELEQVKLTSDQSALIRQLREQLEDAEAARDLALKSKRTAETDIDEMQSLVEEAQRSKLESDEKLLQANKKSREIASQVEELEEENAEMMRKLNSLVSKQELDQKSLQSRSEEVEQLLQEREKLKQDLFELQSKLSAVESDSVDKNLALKLETRIRELEGRYELEITGKTRLQNQLDRLKEQLDRVAEERDSLVASETSEKDKARRSLKQVRDLKEDIALLEDRLTETERKRTDLAQKLETAEDDKASLQTEIRQSKKRISDLQAMLAADQSDVSDDEQITDFSSGDENDRVNQLIRQTDAVLHNKRASSFDRLPQE